MHILGICGEPHPSLLAMMLAIPYSLTKIKLLWKKIRI